MSNVRNKAWMIMGRWRDHYYDLLMYGKPMPAGCDNAIDDVISVTQDEFRSKLKTAIINLAVEQKTCRGSVHTVDVLDAIDRVKL